MSTDRIDEGWELSREDTVFPSELLAAIIVFFSERGMVAESERCEERDKVVGFVDCTDLMVGGNVV